jgi:NADH:ubiquinone reductase (H+-translocating)
MARIVILGGGFAGAFCARALERIAGRRGHEVVLLDRHNYFVFTPLLVEAGTGAIEPRHAVVPLRDLLRSTTLRAAEVLAVHTAARTVRYRLNGTDEDSVLGWDHLVVALGSVTRLPPVAGLAEYALEMKSLTDAVALRDRAIQLLEQADATVDPARRRQLLHFVVVGGSFSGVELAGEMLAFLHEAARYYPDVATGEIRVTLVEMSPRILPALDPDLADYATAKLRRRGMDVRLGTSVGAVGADHVVLSTGERLAARTVIWCAGIAPNPLVAALGLPCDERGWIRCENDLRVQRHADVWALGDCAINPDPRGGVYPETAQHAVRQAAHLARNLVLALAGEPALPCIIDSPGSLAALGCRTAVAKVYGVKLSGFAAWFLWRGIYLFKMPGWARRLRVAIDWAMGLLFPRQIVQLGIHRATDGATRSGGR